jgi:hypothetical protein
MSDAERQWYCVAMVVLGLMFTAVGIFWPPREAPPTSITLGSPREVARVSPAGKVTVPPGLFDRDAGAPQKDPR